MDDSANTQIDIEAILLADLALERGVATPAQVKTALDAFSRRSEEGMAETFLALLARIAGLHAADRDALTLDLVRRIEEAGGNPRLALLRAGSRTVQPHGPAGPSVEGLPSSEHSVAEDAEGTSQYVGFRPLGQGGMGIVYLALDTSLNRDVAYKVMRPASISRSRSTPRTPIEVTPPEPNTADSEAFHEHVQRFLQEAKITGYLEHPSIVPVYELGQTPSGVPYYTMRIVRGKRTLSDAIAEQAGSRFEHRLALLEPFLKVCDAIHYAHEQGIVHRDLKPSNVALGDYGEVVVLDWGLARLSERDDLQETKLLERLESLRSASDVHTVAGALGTPGYMAPEAALGRVEEMDARSDVYSLGVMLFEILTGRIPHPSQTFAEYLARVTAEPAPAVTDADPSIPAALASVCEATVDRNPERRPGTAGALASQIRAWQVHSRIEQKTQALVREAQSALSAADDLSGAELLHQLDRVTGPCHQILHLDPDHAEAHAILAQCAALRVRGVEEQEARARKALRRRVAVAALLLLTVGTLIVSGVLAEKKREAEAARARAVSAERTARTQLARAYADLARELTRSGRHAAAHLAASSALVTAPTRSAWAALGQVARHAYPLPTFMGSGFEAQCAAVHPNGRQLYVGCADGQIRAWDLDSGRALFEFRAHESRIRGILVSPDGRRLLTGGISGEVSLVRVWDLATRQLSETLEGFSGLVLDMQLGPRGRLLYALDASSDEKGGGVHVWDLESGRYLWRVEPIDRDPASWKTRSMCLSADGEHLFLGARGVIVVWSVAWRRPIRTLRGGWGVVSSMVMSPDGKQLWAAYRGNPEIPAPRPVLAWDWQAGTVATELEGVVGGVRALRLATDGERLFGTDVKTGDLLSWNLVRKGRRQKHGEGVPLLLADGEDLLVVAHPQDSLHLLRASDRRLLSSLRAGHKGAVLSLSLDEKAGRLLSLGGDGRAGFWNAENGALERSFHKVDPAVQVVAALPGQPDVYLTSGGTFGKQLELRSVKTGDVVRALAAHADTVFGVQVSPDGERVFSAGSGGQIYISYPLDSKRAPELLHSGLGQPTMVLSRDGTLLFYASRNSSPARIHVFHIPTKSLMGTFRGHQGGVSALAVGTAPDLLYSGGADRRIHVWKLPPPKNRAPALVVGGGPGAPGTVVARSIGALLPPEATLEGHAGPVSAIAVGDAGDFLYSTSAYHTPWILQGAGYREESVIRCWDLRTHRIAALLDGHRGWVSSLVISRDGKRLYSGGQTDRTIIAWRLDAREPACRDISAAHGLPTGGSPTFCMAVSSDGKHLYTGSAGLHLLGQWYGYTRTDHWDLAARTSPTTVKGLSFGSGGCGAEDGRSMLLAPDGKHLFVGRWLEPHDEGAGLSPCDPVVAPPPAAPGAGPTKVTQNVGPRSSAPPKDRPTRPAREPVGAPARVLIGIADLKDPTPKPAYLILPARRRADAVLDMVLSSDGRRLYAAGRSGAAYEYALPDRQFVHRFDVDAGPASSIAVSASERGRGQSLLFVGTRRGLVSVWDLNTMKERMRFRAHLGGVSAMTVSSDGKRLFTAGGGRGVPDEFSPVLRRSDTLIKMWDASTGQLYSTLGGHAHYVEDLSLTDDGTLLVSAGQDGVAILWDAATGAQRAILDATAGAVRAMALTGDGKRLFTAGHDPRIFEWSLDWFLERGEMHLETVQAETGLRVRDDEPDVEVSLWNHLVERMPGTFSEVEGAGR